MADLVPGLFVIVPTLALAGSPRYGAAVLLITYDLAVAERIADRDRRHSGRF